MSKPHQPIAEELTLLATIIGMYLARAFDRKTAAIIAQFINNIADAMLTVLVQDALLFPAETAVATKTNCETAANEFTPPSFATTPHGSSGLPPNPPVSK